MKVTGGRFVGYVMLAAAGAALFGAVKSHVDGVTPAGPLVFGVLGLIAAAMGVAIIRTYR